MPFALVCKGGEAFGPSSEKIEKILGINSSAFLKAHFMIINL
jgi:hypothetical protein